MPFSVLRWEERKLLRRTEGSCLNHSGMCSRKHGSPVGTDGGQVTSSPLQRKTRPKTPSGCPGCCHFPLVLLDRERVKISVQQQVSFTSATHLPCSPRQLKTCQPFQGSI